MNIFLKSFHKIIQIKNQVLYVNVIKFSRNKKIPIFPIQDTVSEKSKWIKSHHFHTTPTSKHVLIHKTHSVLESFREKLTAIFRRHTPSRKITRKYTLHFIHFRNFPFEIAQQILASHSNHRRLFIFAFRRGVCISRRHECMQTSFSAGWNFFTDRLTPLNITHIIYIPHYAMYERIIIFTGAFRQNVAHDDVRTSLPTRDSTLWFTMANARKVHNSYRRQIIRIGFEIVPRCDFEMEIYGIRINCVC